MKLSAGKQHAIFITIMATGMSFVMSLTMTMVLLGIDRWTLSRWLKAWAIAFCVAWPCAYVLAPLARKITMKVSK